MISQAFDHLLEGLLAPLQNSVLPFTVADATAKDLPLVLVNDAFSDLTGYARADVIGRNCRFLQGPETDHRAVADIRSALSAGRAISRRLLNYRRDGRPFLNDLIITPVRDTTGTLRFFTGVQVMISESVPEAHLAHRVRAALVPEIGLVEVAVAGGVAPGWLDRLACGDRPRLANAVRQTIAAGHPLQITLSMFDEAGRLSSMSIDASRLADDPIYPPGAVLFEGCLRAANLNHQVKTQLTLLERVAVTANDVILITAAEPLSSPGPIIVYVNDAITRHTGYRPENLVGLTPRLFQGPLSDQQALRDLGRELRTWQAATIQVLNYRIDGSTFWNDISISPVADEFGWWTHWIAIQRDVTDRQIAAEQISFLANHDPLSGLANRRLTATRLQSAIETAQAARAACGIIKIDLDNFKQVNDTFGHAAGDAVIVEVASRLGLVSRGRDTVARLGGDEFLVVMNDLATRADMEAAMVRIMAQVTGPYCWKAKKLMISCSVGASMYPDDADDADRLLASADAALYQAKRQGRGRAVLFSPGLRAETAEARTVRADLRDAIDQHQFEPFFQPQFRLSDGQLSGFEVLVRWNHPQRGLISPAGFLPVAADAGLMDAVDKCVLQAAIKIVGQWVAEGLSFGRVAVNISQQTFSRPECVADITGLLERHAVAPHLLSVEVVESILMDDANAGVSTTLSALRAAGITVELDDFGTGYASLAHLRMFKVDRLKLDRSFVAGIGLDKESEAIVRAIVTLAQSCGIDCIAEGVETEAQLAFLRAIACDHVQGFLFGRPCTARDARRFIETARLAAPALTPSTLAFAGPRLAERDAVPRRRSTQAVSGAEAERASTAYTSRL